MLHRESALVCCGFLWKTLSGLLFAEDAWGDPSGGLGSSYVGLVMLRRSSLHTNGSES